MTMERKNEYELIYIVPAEKFESVDAVRGMARLTIEKHGGQVTRESEPQKRKLAYIIKNTRNGIYLIIRFIMEDGEKIKEISREIGLAKDILRHMIVTAQELPKEKEKPKTELDKIIELDREEKNLIEEITKKKDEAKAAEKAEPVKAKEEAGTEVKEKTSKKKDIEKVEEISAKKEESAMEEVEKEDKKAEKAKADKGEKKSIKSSVKKDKLKFEDLDKKLDDILKDDLI